MKSCMFIQSPPIVELGSLVIDQMPTNGGRMIFLGGSIFVATKANLTRVNALARTKTTYDGGIWTGSQSCYLSPIGGNELAAFNTTAGGVPADIFRFNYVTNLFNGGAVPAPVANLAGFRYDPIGAKVYASGSAVGIEQFNLDGTGLDTFASAAAYGCVAVDSTGELFCNFFGGTLLTYRTNTAVWDAFTAVSNMPAANDSETNEESYSDGTYFWRSSFAAGKPNIVRTDIATSVQTTYPNSAGSGTTNYQQVMPLGDGRLAIFGQGGQANNPLVIFNPANGGSFYRKNTGIATNFGGCLAIDTVNRIICVCALNGTLMKFYGY